MTKLDKLAIAIDTAETIGLFDDCEAIAVLNMKDIPESYKFIQDYICYEYRVSVYDMRLIGKRSYLLHIHGVDKFQIF